MATLQDYLGITKLRDAWPKWKANVVAVNNQVIDHVAGSADKHLTSDITNDSEEAGTTTADAINTNKAKVAAHVAGTADKHSAQDITYTGDFVGKTEVKAALDQAKTEIDTIVVNASIDPEVALARDSTVKGETFDTLDARLEESEQDLVSHKADAATKQISVMYPPVPLVPLKGDGFDETIQMDAIIAILNIGDVLFFPTPSVKYLRTQPLNIEQHGITLLGTSPYKDKGTILEFDGCNGLVNRGTYVNLKSIHVRGVNKLDPSLIDIPNKQFGTIGLKNEYSDSFTSGALKTTNVTITGFNTNYATYAEGSSIWAGAYREHRDLYLGNGDVGLVSLDGVTHDKFYGGRITSNAIHGIYADVQNDMYNNLEFIGTTIESNGDNPVFTDPGYTNFGVYCGNKSNLRFTNCYLEVMSLFSDVGGVIDISSTYIHQNVRMFGSGVIVNNSSLGSYSNKSGFSIDLSTRVTASNLVVANLSTVVPSIKLTSSVNGDNRLTFETVQLRNLPVKNLKGIKLSFNYKINSGITSPTFGIKPKFTTTGASSIDGSNVNLVAPIDVFPSNNVLGEQRSYEVYYQPRTGVGYLDIADILTTLSVAIGFTNDKVGLNSDYSSDNLDIEIMNPVINVYSDVEIGVSSDEAYLFELMKNVGVDETITLLNGWTGTLTYSKNVLGQVWLRGNLTVGTFSAGTSIGVLPIEYRPVANTSIYEVYRTSTPPTVFTGGIITGSSGSIAIISDISDNLATGNTVRIDKIFQA